MAALPIAHSKNLRSDHRFSLPIIQSAPTRVPPITALLLLGDLPSFYP